MSHPNVESLLQSVESPVELARDPQIGPLACPKVSTELAIRREGRHAWRETAAVSTSHEVELVADVEQVVGSAVVTA